MCLQSVECAEKVMRQLVMHIVSECKKLAQKQYRCWRHDKVALVIHWDLYVKSWVMTGMKNITVTSHDQCMNPVLNKLLWDFKIQTDNKVEHNKPDIVVLDKTERKCLIIDVACPFDIRVKGKEKDEIENYQELKCE